MIMIEITRYLNTDKCKLVLLKFDAKYMATVFNNSKSLDDILSYCNNLTSGPIKGRVTGWTNLKEANLKFEKMELALRTISIHDHSLDQGECLIITDLNRGVAENVLREHGFKYTYTDHNNYSRFYITGTIFRLPENPIHLPDRFYLYHTK